ncbi:hypothetical protein AAW00_10600 [Aurantiacibacter luteus]|uniref:Heme oxygenase n=1 Tax=Aurantiacibacter luteus TaxID=1581420 RepID=A0A0G9MVV4_9SPHN|nr:hypothetical protein AAW00_10600 [Aurantiacibacter luteus]
MRGYLKARTAGRHDVLDALGAPESFADRGAYCDFLARQFAARLGLEHWVALYCPADLAPPPMAELLADDLAANGCAFPHYPTRHFALPAGADPLGLAWVVAGSHLGNRAMLARLRREAPGTPAAFLADERMQAFWKALRPRLEAQVSPAEAEGAALAAEAVFDHFLAAFAAHASERIAA